MTYFILRTYTGTGVSHSRHREKVGEVVEKNAGEWTGRVEISEEEISCSKRSMYGHVLTYARLFSGRTFKVCVLTKWDFNSCVRSSPLRVTFVILARLNRHCMRKHNGYSSFLCKECGAVFPRFNRLQVHMRTHTGHYDKPFLCNECGAMFTRSSHLKAHMRIHTGQRPFFVV